MALEENPDLEKLLFVWQNYWKIGHLLGGTVHALFFSSLQISDYIFSYSSLLGKWSNSDANVVLCI